MTRGHTGEVAVIAGIRSQIVKLAAFQRGVAEYAAAGAVAPRCLYINAAQHYDDPLARQYIQELDVQFDVDLTSRARHTDPTRMTAELFVRLFRLLSAQRPPLRLALVFGDANTTLAGTLAARKAGVPVAHVEAGVRTFVSTSSEEINRIVADRLATLHFASCARDLAQLRAEGYGGTAVFAGDLIRDLVCQVSADSTAPEPTLEALSLGSPFALVTLHRAENTGSDAPLRAILGALASRVQTIVLVRHPRTRHHIEGLEPRLREPLQVYDSLPYLTFLRLLKHAAYVVTDSGAVQRESFYLRQRCLVRQDVVFWPTLVEAGVHRSVGSTLEAVLDGCAWRDSVRDDACPELSDFGDGRAAKVILDGVRDYIRADS